MGVPCALRCPCAIDVHVGNDVDECMAEGGSLEMRRAMHSSVAGSDASRLCMCEFCVETGVSE